MLSTAWPLALASCLALAAAAPADGAGGATEVSITRFLDPRDGPDDATPPARRALAFCKEHGVRKLVFPKAIYHFKPDRAAEQFLFISNNTDGLKRIAFPLEGVEDFEVDGQGSTFIFHGYLLPFYLKDAKRITLRNFSVDFHRAFQSEGRILAVGDGTIDVEFSDQFPYRTESGLLKFYGSGEDEKVEYPSGHLLEFDPVKRETAFMVRDYYIGETMHAEELAPGRVRVRVPGVAATVGNVFVFGPSHRRVPDIAVEDSDGVVVDDVTLHSSGGMGLIAQRSGNISVTKMKVTPADGRTISTTADATHFVNCYGKIELIDCLFESQMDDATNIHGIYAQVSRVLSPTELEVRLVHHEQLGFDFLVPGLRVELVDPKSMVTYADAAVKSAERLNEVYTRVTFDKPLPDRVAAKDVIADAEHYPDVLVKGCTTRGNRARGMLIGSRGKVVIEGNTFHVPGAAILLEGDGSHWFEQAGVRDLTVRGNTFDNCNFGVWGKAVIQVGAGIAKDLRAESRYNRNILIEGNTFRMFDSTPIIDAYSVEGLSFSGNQIVKTNDYPAAREGGGRFVISDSGQVDIE